MANELQFTDEAITGSTLYVVVWNVAGQAWNGSAFATYTSTRGTWDIAATEISGTGLWQATMPGTAGFRRWAWYLQAGGSPSHASDVQVAIGNGYWDGSSIVAQAGISGDIAGKVLGGGSGTIAGAGVRALDGSGNAIAPASTALTNATWTNALATRVNDTRDIAATIATQLGGISSLANWLRAFFRKGNTDATAVNEINADAGDGAGTYAPADDSAEAIGDKVMLAASYTAPDNAGVAAVKAKTDQLAFEDNKVNANAESTVDEQAIIDGVVAGVGSSGGPVGLTEEQAMQLDLTHATITNGTYGAAATKTALDAVAASASAAASSASTAATQSSGANTKAANIQGRIPDALEDGRIKSTGEFTVTSEQVEAIADRLVLAGVGVVITPVSQVAVPLNRTWRLKNTTDGLKGESRINKTLSDTNLVYAIDFAADLPTNGRVVEILEVEVVDGDADGITLGDDLSNIADYGVDRSKAHVRISPVTAGTYTLGVTVQVAGDQGGGESYGEVVIKFR
jgi:hypothetical protein